ncbi:MAG: hypothetical protein HYY76_12795 [Acidobacteria bacterium]|nr:hypothetical protein [Acidobacteriota bacterium]
MTDEEIGSSDPTGTHSQNVVTRADAAAIWRTGAMLRPAARRCRGPASHELTGLTECRSPLQAYAPVRGMPPSRGKSPFIE